MEEKNKNDYNLIAKKFKTIKKDLFEESKLKNPDRADISKQRYPDSAEIFSVPTTINPTARIYQHKDSAELHSVPAKMSK